MSELTLNYLWVGDAMRANQHVPANPTSFNHASYSPTKLAPLIHPTYSPISLFSSGVNSFFARISLTANLPPGFNRRYTSLKHTGFSSCANKLMTQLLMIQSALSDSKGIFVIGASTNFTFVMDALEAFLSARESMSWLMSTPIERPVGPIFRAAWKTSKPAPEPRSITVSP